MTCSCYSLVLTADSKHLHHCLGHLHDPSAPTPSRISLRAVRPLDSLRRCLGQSRHQLRINSRAKCSRHRLPLACSHHRRHPVVCIRQHCPVMVILHRPQVRVIHKHRLQVKAIHKPHPQVKAIHKHRPQVKVIPRHRPQVKAIHRPRPQVKAIRKDRLLYQMLGEEIPTTTVK